MKKLCAVAIVLASFCVNVSAEDVTDAFIKCATTKDDRQRLSCYDSIGAKFAKQYQQSQSNKGSYSPIQLADLKTDLKQLIGKKVSTTGKLQVMGGLEMVFLKTDELDMAPVSVTGEALPRDDRKKLLNGCQVVLCKANVSGTVKKGPLGPQLVAEQVTWF